MDEEEHVAWLLAELQFNPTLSARATARATVLVEGMRRRPNHGIEALLQEYALSSQEGIALMCLAEALLRIPDSPTLDDLIHQKLAEGDWYKHLGHSASLFVNASTWGLLLSGKWLAIPHTEAASVWERLWVRLGEPVIRIALKEAVRILGQQFVMGRNIEQALTRSQSGECTLYRHSFDCLGEAALTARDAERYFVAYSEAIRAIAATLPERADIFSAPGMSIKLSALHPRYEEAQRERVLTELVPRVLALAQQARAAGIGLTMDAEEAERLELSLDVFARVYASPSLQGWAGWGLAVQAYQKRAVAVIDWLAQLVHTQPAAHQRCIPVRLVKGAYWDSEIKRAQERGLEGYPVFTRKPATDLSYLVCAQRLLAQNTIFYPQFATHNAHTVATLMEMAMALRSTRYEFQRLHGMGEALYSQLIGGEAMFPTCRVYAPVGSYEELLPYLVRRLLENGANTSFVHHVADPHAAPQELVADPIEFIAQVTPKANPTIALPHALFGTERPNSPGVNVHHRAELADFMARLEQAAATTWQAGALINGVARVGDVQAVYDPSCRDNIVGHLTLATPYDADYALTVARRAHTAWEITPVNVRAGYLERAAQLFTDHRHELAYLIVREGGRTLVDALSEIREAVDFCYYHAQLARQQFGQPLVLAGPTGEYNDLTLHGRGVFVCISPWNFPLAIFVGQVTAALAAGNCVIAKPASATPLTAMRATQLLHAAGIPPEVLHLLPGGGNTLGLKLCSDERVAGVAFTGSTATARLIHQTLAARSGPIIPFIAETGGQNAMIVDSSALPEQVVSDVVRSAFNSAGQRCSALRVLFLQADIAPRILGLLQGAMAELVIGDPLNLATDIGPLINAAASEALTQHAQHMADVGTIVYGLPLPKSLERGHFFSPRAFEITDLTQLTHEVFGPILHIINYQRGKLDRVIDAINATGYGLTLGIHTRLEDTVRYVQSRAHVGNIYVNRNMIGAVVGVQPFGGEGLSGTGPKIGGPHYLHGYATERAFSMNTTAVGGDVHLITRS